MSGRRVVTAACLGLVRRIVPSLRAGATRKLRQPACPDGTRPHPYIDEMTREELLSELVAEHNATVAPGERRLSEGDLRTLLKFLRWREWTHGARAAAGGAKSLPREQGDVGSTAECL